MTLDEAIEHAKQVARTCEDNQCAADHIQLAEWLRMARGAEAAGRWYTAKVRELESENAKLREQIHWLKQGDILHVLTDQEYIDQLRERKNLWATIDSYDADNANLKELAHDMLYDAMENVCSKAYWCGEKSWQTCNDKKCGNRLYVERGRDLGVEVEQ